MAVITSKTKYVNFYTKAKKLNFDNQQVIFNSNEIRALIDPTLIFPLERIHNNNPENS